MRKTFPEAKSWHMEQKPFQKNGLARSRYWRGWNRKTFRVGKIFNQMSTTIEKKQVNSVSEQETIPKKTLIKID
jgi:hypothetical protein